MPPPREQAVGVAFVAYCAFQLRDSMLLRPHPVVWRVVHGLVRAVGLPLDFMEDELRLRLS